MNTDCARLTRVFKALSCENSVRIVRELGKRPCYVTELAGILNLHQENVSRRLKKLMDAGLVTYKNSRHDARTRHYYLLTPEALQAIEELLTPAEKPQRRRTKQLA